MAAVARVWRPMRCCGRHDFMKVQRCHCCDTLEQKWHVRQHPPSPNATHSRSSGIRPRLGCSVCMQSEADGLFERSTVVSGCF